MITISPKVPPQIRGGNPFGFRTDNRIKESRHLKARPPEALTQDRIIAEVRVQLEQLRNWPCEVNVIIGTQEGQSIVEGEIKAYEQRTFEQATAVVETVRAIAFKFSQQHPRSSFTVSAQQTVTITKVYPKLPSGGESNN